MPTDDPAIRWSRFSALAGGILWTGLTALSPETPWLYRLFLLAPLVIVPLGFALVRPILPTPVLLLQPIVASILVLSFWLPPGVASAAFAFPWLIHGSIAALSDLFSLWKFRKGVTLPRISQLVSILFLPAGGIWLVTSRFGYLPLDFVEPIVFLTAVHFHYTGFSLLLLASLVGIEIQRLPGNRRPALYKFVVAGLLAGTPLTAIGFVCSPVLQLGGSLILAASCMLLAALQWMLTRRPQPGPAKALLICSSLSVPVAMIPVILYAVGEFSGNLLLSIPAMIRIHGTINAFGFILCGMAGWNLRAMRLAQEPV